MKVRLLKRWPRRLIIELGILVLVAVVLGVKVWSDVGALDDDVAKSTLSAQAQIKDASSQFSAVLAGEGESADPLEAYTAYVAAVRDSLCVNFEESFYARFAPSMVTCYQKRDALSGVIDALDGIRALQLARRDIDALLPKQNATTTALTRDAWQAALTKLKNLSVDASIEGYREAIIDAVEAITADWKAVAQADADKNAEAFDEAQQQLIADVAKIGEINALDDEIMRQQTALNAALQQFYD